MQPVTPSTSQGRSLLSPLSWPTRPSTRSSAFSRMAQVLTRITSASSGPSRISKPSLSSAPSMSSLSEMFI